MNKKVKNICGDYPSDFEKIDISSNPNFVFVNDPNYGPVKVWDAEENFVFVNSFIECEHYVTGGWDKNPIEDRELGLQTSLISIVLVVTLFLITGNKFCTKIRN